MKRMCHKLAAVAMALGVLSGPAAGAEKALTVVELFTSQGCSSCPPADALVGELAKRDDVLALSVHVDYWDYIGWKDPYARAEHTERQRQYSRKFELRYVYTPQMVVHGAYQSVGGDRGDIMEMVDKARALPRVPVKLKRGPNGVQLDLPAGSVDGDVEILSVFFDRRHDTNIKRGENSGRTLSHYNVVRRMQRIGTWNGEAMRMSVMSEDAGGEVCAVILQMAGSRQIIGADWIALNGT